MNPTRRRCARGKTNWLLALAILAGILFGQRSSGAPLPTKLGDLNGDGQITVLDLVSLINHVNRTSLLASSNVPFADLNGDSFVNETDIDLLADLILGLPLPTKPVSLEPANGASEVGVTDRPKVIFPRPVDVSTLNSNNFFASFSGQRLRATIVPANNGTFAWLFFDPPMANASQIQVTVDGSTITNLLGQALDADGDGAPGGSVRVNFSTVSVTPIPGTVLTSLIVDPGPDLVPRTPDDVILGDRYLLPIAGVRVYVLGMESNVAYTDASGRFTLTNMPVGDVKVVLDGRTATNPPTGYYFPEMVMDTKFEPGITNGVMTIRDVNGNEVRDGNGVPIQALAMYLPRVASNVLQTISAAVTNLITLQSNAAYTLSEAQRQYLTMEVMPGSLVGMDGQPLNSAQVGVSVVPPELVKDMLPPGLLQHSFDITIQAPGVAAFSTPAPMTFPNIYNAPPGTKLSFLSFNHTTGRLEFDGTCTVSDDGLYIRTDPGTGITHPGWHVAAPPGCRGKGRRPIPESDDTDGCGNKLAGIFRKPTACIKETDKCISGLFPFIVAAFDKFGGCAPLISSGNDDKHGQRHDGTWKNDRHYCNQAIDLSGMCPLFRPNGRYPDAVMLAIASEIAGQPLTHCNNPSEWYCTSFAKEIDGMTCNLQIIYECPGTIHNSLHIQLTDGDCDHSFPDPSRHCKCQSALRSPSPAFGGDPSSVLDPMPPYDVLITTASGTELRLRTDEAGSFEAFLPPDEYGLISLFARNASVVWVHDFFTGASGSTTELTSQTQGEWERRLTFFPPQALDDLAEEMELADEVWAPTAWHLHQSRDSDADGLGDLAELILGTDQGRADTDTDGLTDFAEIQQGLDPLSGLALTTGIISALPLPGEAKEVVLEGSTLNGEQQTAYVALGASGLGIVNASQFQKPILLGQLDLPGDATDVAVDSNLRIAAVAANAGGLHFVNVADPMNPALLQTLALNASQVEVIGGVAYVAAGGNLWSLDLTSRALLQQLPLGGASLTGLASEGLFLYTMDSSHVLRAIDLRNGIMTNRGSLTMPSGGGKVFVGNGIAYMAAEAGFSGGFATADVSNPDALVLLSGVDAANVAGRAVMANGSGLAIAVGAPTGQGNVLDVLNVSDPANTGVFQTRHFLMAPPFSVAIGAGVSFVADGTGGLQVVNYRSFDSSNRPPTITLSNSFVMLTPTNGLAEEGKLVLVSARTTDDVQVRNVEFYVDGVKVFSDASFPFEHRFITPALSASKSNFTVRARAIDTGGNSTWTDEINVTLTRDATPPRVLRTIPKDGSVLSFTNTVNTVFAFFNEPIDQARLSSSSFYVVSAGPDTRLGTGDDVILPGAVSYRDTLNAVVIAFPSALSLGVYRGVLTTAIADVAGNHLATNVAWTFALLTGGPDGDDDGDDVSNAEEIAHGTNPFLADTDGDGWSDRVEIDDGTDPLNPASRPNTTFVARPPLQLEIPSPEVNGTAGVGTFVARPPVLIDLPSQETFGNAGVGVFLARPPVLIDLPSADTSGVAGFGLFLAKPPVSVLIGTNAASPALPLAKTNGVSLKR